MRLKILCSVHLVRHPVGGHTWHHLQYLVGLQRLGHEVAFFEHFGWPSSCYDAARDLMTPDPSYGLQYMRSIYDRLGLDARWSYFAEDGREHGLPRSAIAAFARECDLYLNLSNMNWIDELEHCRRRVMVDTDPVFTQIGSHGMGGEFSNYHRFFTYGENVHKPNCEMPTGGRQWLSTRQPVVLDLWPVTAANPDAPLTTVVNWSAYGAQEFEGRVYGQKDREFVRYERLPRETGQAMEVAMNGPDEVKARFAAGGWRLGDVGRISRDPWSYQAYLSGSRGEFCVAKHAYVSTRCGWFSDRSSAYLALGRPVILQDTGFSENLPTGEGLMAFNDDAQAVACVERLREDYPRHCAAARAVAEEHLDARRVLSDLIERAM